VEAADRSDRFRVTASGNGGSEVHEADALVLATGFQAYSPEDKPYGYGKFKNVVTNLELERMLRKENLPRRPSDGAFPERMAFIQCVGSRDARLKHLWCSQVCCASALRMARLIRFRRPETDIVFFYIDVQTFGADFDAFYERVKTEIRMVREIPADFYPVDDGRLRIPYFDAESGKEAETICDMAVLSVGMTPGPDNRDLAEKLGFSPAGTGFLEDPAAEGVFIAGAAGGPMSIPDAVRSAGETAARVRNYLSRL
jgi:heterodisulfide reductase subunit A